MKEREVEKNQYYNLGHIACALKNMHIFNPTNTYNITTN